MSAFILPAAHLDYLLSAAWVYEVTMGGLTILDHAQMAHDELVSENNASVFYLYKNSRDIKEIMSGAIEPMSREPKLTRKIDPIHVLKALDCYEYQSNEHPEWKDSRAVRFCDELRRTTITRLPGYDAAAWTRDG